MLSESLTIAKAGLSALRKPFKACVRKGRIWFFQLRTKRPPLNEVRAKQVAHSVLAGDVMEAVSFRNIDLPHIFIACLRRSSEQESDPVVYVLAQIGDTFTCVWKSDRLYATNRVALEVHDADDDGNREVLFEDQSFGTGGGTRRLMVYCPGRGTLFTITESLNWQNLAGPISPEVKIEPTSRPEMVGILENVAKRRGFLGPGTLVNFDDAEFAVQRWHKENGKRTSGRVRVHYYQGYPKYKASIAATLDTGSVVWLSFFKGPLFGYEKLKDRHFIAYSPAWFYNWAKCFVIDGDILWFGVHCRNGLMSFRPSDNLLESYESFQNNPLPEVQELVFDRGFLVINRTLNIAANALTQSRPPGFGVM